MSDQRKLDDIFGHSPALTHAHLACPVAAFQLLLDMHVEPNPSEPGEACSPVVKVPACRQSARLTSPQGQEHIRRGSQKKPFPQTEDSIPEGQLLVHWFPTQKPLPVPAYVPYSFPQIARAGQAAARHQKHTRQVPNDNKSRADPSRPTGSSPPSPFLLTHHHPRNVAALLAQRTVVSLTNSAI